MALASLNTFAGIEGNPGDNFFSSSEGSAISTHQRTQSGSVEHVKLSETQVITTFADLEKAMKAGLLTYVDAIALCAEKHFVVTPADDKMLNDLALQHQSSEKRQLAKDSQSESQQANQESQDDDKKRTGLGEMIAREIGGFIGAVSELMPARSEAANPVNLPSITGNNFTGVEGGMAASAVSSGGQPIDTDQAVNNATAKFAMALPAADTANAINDVKHEAQKMAALTEPGATQEKSVLPEADLFALKETTAAIAASFGPALGAIKEALVGLNLDMIQGFANLSDSGKIPTEVGTTLASNASFSKENTAQAEGLGGNVPA